MKISTKRRAKLFVIGITLLSILCTSCGKSREEKIEAIVIKLGLVETYKTNYQYRLEALKYQAIGNDSIRLIALEKQLTDESIFQTISSAFDEVSNEKEINELYQFLQTTTFEKFFKSGEAYKAINSRFLSIENELKELTENTSSIVERPTSKFEPIPVERIDGFYTVKGDNYSLEDENFELEDKPALDSRDISEVRKAYSSYNNRPEIEIVFTKDGARKFHRVTKENISKPIAIVIAKHIVSMPTVNGAIMGGKASISGDFSEDEIDYMIARLKE